MSPPARTYSRFFFDIGAAVGRTLRNLLDYDVSFGHASYLSGSEDTRAKPAGQYKILNQNLIESQSANLPWVPRVFLGYLKQVQPIGLKLRAFRLSFCKDNLKFNFLIP